MGPHRAEEEVNKIMAEVDNNGSGSIDYSGLMIHSYDRIRSRYDQQRLSTVQVEVRNGI